MNQDQLGQNSNSGSSAETTDDSVELRRFRRYYLESALWNLEACIMHVSFTKKKKFFFLLKFGVVFF